MIPARNLYYMFLYAWGHFRASELTDVGNDDSPDLPTFLARILNERTHRLLRQGLDRGYVTFSEEGRSPRGRLILNEMVKRQTLLRGAVVCALDELTPDVLHNRILLETLLCLASNPRVPRQLRHELRLTTIRMHGVSRIHLTRSVFKRVQLSRNTAQYRLLMHICELLFDELMPDAEGKTGRLLGIANDEVRMPALFEQFLRSFYNLELIGHRASAEIIRWDAETDDAMALGLMPVMRTDITVRAPGRVLVIDAKYYPSHLTSSQFGEKRLRSDHLYQLSAYLAHIALREPANRLDGMLLYPQADQPVDLSYQLLGRRMKVTTVNLSDTWQNIHTRLLELGKES